MSKKLSDIINFYQQNDIDEIYLEKSINRFTEKNIKIGTGLYLFVFSTAKGVNEQKLVIIY